MVDSTPTTSEARCLRWKRNGQVGIYERLRTIKRRKGMSMNQFRPGAEKGFSLVELMVVVAIIGILASIAMPKFRTFQAKARQVEAKGNLSQIYTLEEAYLAENDKYATVTTINGTGAGGSPTTCNVPGAGNPIGFYVSDCSKLRYSYVWTAVTTNTFTTTATSGAGAGNLIYPGCAIIDTWTVNQNNSLNVTAGRDASVACAN